MDVVERINKICAEYGITNFGDKDLDPKYSGIVQVVVSAKILEKLDEINNTLKSMKQQEKDYWNTWQKAKEKEQSQPNSNSVKIGDEPDD